MFRPYQIQYREGYWVVVDCRTGALASYPTNKRQAQDEADTMNEAYAEAVAELGE